MTAIGDFVVEVAPDRLSFVQDASTPELVAAALLLLVADDVPESIWAGRFQVVEAALKQRCVGTSGRLPMTEAELVVQGMSRLPFELRERIAPRLRAGINKRKAAQPCP